MQFTTAKRRYVKTAEKPSTASTTIEMEFDVEKVIKNKSSRPVLASIWSEPRMYAAMAKNREVIFFSLMSA